MVSPVPLSPHYPRVSFVPYCLAAGSGAGLKDSEQRLWSCCCSASWRQPEGLTWRGFCSWLLTLMVFILPVSFSSTAWREQCKLSNCSFLQSLSIWIYSWNDSRQSRVIHLFIKCSLAALYTADNLGCRCLKFWTKKYFLISFFLLIKSTSTI